MSQLGAVKIDVTAIAGTIATATVIPKGQVFTHVGTCAVANDGVKLPIDKVGTIYIVRNDGAQNLRVFPPDANSNINAGGVGVHFNIASGAQGRFIITGLGAITALGAGGVQYFSF